MAYTAQISETHSGSPDRLYINLAAKEFSAKLTVYRFEDHGFAINYIPALNLSGYGATMDEARDMLIHVVMDDYSDNILALPMAAVHEELSRLGWSIAGRDISNFENKAYIDKDGVLQNFNLPQDTVIEEGVLDFA